MSEHTDGTTSITVDELANDLFGQALAAHKAGDKEEPSEPQKTEAEPADVETEEAPESDTDSVEESESDEPTESTEPATPEPRKLKVKIDGVETELPEDEVVKGYQRNADYTRKTQAAADLRKSLEAEAAQVKAERSHLATQLHEIKAALDAQVGKEPDWDTLRMGDPAVFAAKYSEWDLGQKNLAKVEAAQQELARRNAVDAANARSELLKAESQKLTEMIPSWKDEAVATAEKTDLVAHARSRGFTDEELANVTDARTLLLLRDAWLGAKSSAAKPVIKAKIEAVKVAAPGVPATHTRPKEQAVKEAAKRVAATGKVSDFEDWLVKRAKL